MGFCLTQNGYGGMPQNMWVVGHKICVEAIKYLCSWPQPQLWLATKLGFWLSENFCVVQYKTLVWYNTNWVCGIPENMSKVGQKMCVVDFKIFVFVQQKRRFCLTQNDLWLTIKLGCGFWPKTGCLFDPEGVCVLFALKKGYWKYVCGWQQNWGYI